MRIMCLCLALRNFLHSLVHPSSTLVTMAILIPHWVVNSDRLSPEEDRFREDFYYEALTFSRHDQPGVRFGDYEATEGW